MGSVDRDDNRIFKANFSTDGAAKLKESVTEKLKEFMGEYTDDTLVEYVIVILRNGKSKKQAKNELNVFLGDDSDSFVSWLWDHLHLNLALYVKPEKLNDEAPKRKLISELQAGADVIQHSNSELERRNSNKLSGSRRNKDWKGLVREEVEAPTIRSSEVDNAHLEEKVQPKVNRGSMSSSPDPALRRKRGRADEQQRTKRDVVSQVNIAAPRRLLQFAVRDAVGTPSPRTSSFGTSVEPSLKRLRSVVSTSPADSSLVEHYQHVQPTLRLPNAMATVIKAVAEAAEDVKSKSSGSVFDRLGCGMDSLANNSQHDYQYQEQNQSLHLQRTDYERQYAANTISMEHETGFPSDSNSDNEESRDLNVIDRGMTETSKIRSSVGNRGSDSLLMQYSVAKNTDDSLRLRQERPTAVARSPSRKIVNISVNVNTWKPSQYQEPREIADLNGHKILDNETGGPRSNIQLVKENTNALKNSNGNVNIVPDVQKESSKVHCTTGSSVAVRPSEDVDSRTIFVSNVHFAATKDGLSRHFNKFGEVLKVIIVTDAATGQPKGAAYVEFMLKEAADNALSLDSTSFMSRILKVVKKSAAQQESAPTMTWPHAVRGSPFSTARFPRHPLSRGIPSSFRPRPPMKLGPRSMQWKRDTQDSPANSGSCVNTGNITMPAMPATRGLTYIRTQSKP